MLRLLIRYQEKTIDPQDGHYPCWSSSFGVGPNRYDLPDLIGFLVFHGDTLLFLDLNAFPHIRTILYLCSLLTDLLLQPRLENRTLQPPPTPKTPIPITRTHTQNTTTPRQYRLRTDCTTTSSTSACTDACTRRPCSVHRHSPSVHTLVQRNSDTTFRTFSRSSFPKLEKVRLLSPWLLQHLSLNVPREGECFTRWVK